MVAESKSRKAGPVARWLAGLACLVLLVLAVLLFPLFPLAAIAERPASLIVPVLSLGLAFFAGKFAVTGRVHRWPWDKGTP